MNRLLPDPEALENVGRKYGIRRLSRFRSILTGRAGPKSDVDLLVEFQTGTTPGFLGMAAIEAELSALLGGRTVVLRTQRS